MIRKATDNELLGCLRDPTVLSRISIYPDKVRVNNNYVVEDGEEQLFFIYMKLRKKTAEMHVAAIKKHRFKAKKMIKEALEFMRIKGYRKIITWAPEIYQSTVNMAINLGFKEMYKKRSPLYKCDVVYLSRDL